MIHDLPRASSGPTPDLAASSVRDTTSGDVIVKLVSKADQPIRAKVDLSSAGRFQPVATRTVLSGYPLAENRFGRDPDVLPDVLPDVSELDVSAGLEVELPAYSLTVLRLRSAGER